MGPFKYNIANTLNMSLPFPLFSTYNADGIPPDTSVKFSFNVDSNYPTNILIRSVFDRQIMENTINGTKAIYSQGIEDRIIKQAGVGQNVAGIYDDAPIK